jgi:hypothetical protein
MFRRSAWLLLACLVLPGCWYALAAQVAISTISAVAANTSKGSSPEQGELPQNREALLAAYKDCLRQKGTTPALDCSRYRSALGMN